jgi:hypothetical protein
MMTEAPSEAKAFADAYPIPDVPPVTKTTLFSNLLISNDEPSCSLILPEKGGKRADFFYTKTGSMSICFSKNYM